MMKVMTTLATLALLGSQSVSAQGLTQNTRDVRNPTPTLDNQLAKCLAIDNWVEVELAKFAQSKSQSDDVKQFAQALQKDHEQFAARLKQIDPSSAELISSEKPSEHHASEVHRDARTIERTTINQDAKEQREALAAGDRDATPRQPEEAAQMLNIKHEVAAACVATFKKELGSKSANDFDRCYLGEQIGAHLQMLDTAKVFEQHAAPELAKALGEFRETTQKHLEHAKQLLAQRESKLARTDR